MYSLEERQRAVDLLIKYDRSVADVRRELGYPSKRMLKIWRQEYEENGSLHQCYKGSNRLYSQEQKKEAVDYYLAHGRSLSRTVRAVGYPTKEALRLWIDELAPGERKVFTKMTRDGKADISFSQKKSAVVDLCSRKGSAREVAAEHGTNRGTLYQWKYELLGKEEMPVRPVHDKPLPDDIKSLQQRIEELKKENEDLELEGYRLKMEVDILNATAEVLKKDRGIDPERLTNREKTIVIDALRTVYPLNELLKRLSMAKSSYFYQRNALTAPDRYADVRKRIREVFEASGNTYGYRRVYGELKNEDTVLSEKVVMRIMAEEDLTVVLKRRRKYSSFKGEIPAVGNLVQRNFHAGAPNELWLTDLTEFHIPAGKVYLSPLLDCFDGALVSWTIGTSPNAELVNTMLDIGIETLTEGEHPIVHNDMGCHYGWPGWIERMDNAGLTRSMSKKGCSPDNAACEGLFGRIKNEMFYYRSWKGVGIEEFIGVLDSYLHWYNNKRIKKSLGYKSPVDYRKSLGLAA